ncbi:coiled-coil domain-containing protein 93-like isoform X2 [Mya arenaria]|uniref:coiled-coil domain-containing protein 93-like isoform X2 n=1 Tax=Mya arenaria TaxID=6604 RepID=UPI0022E1A81C|nr:coiled-coil domain-containing protein 93-like isoform X2 [Mya arenaria]
MAASGSLFAGKKRTGSILASAPVDADGNEQDFDVREDEEQNVKLLQTIELLLAAGYFRARIKGLSPFDKVVGGMTWCITTCNVDIDIDLLFQENSTIGQKIALTEKIVAVLPRMKCPHRIEPHQIQGLDFIHIYPVVQDVAFLAVKDKAIGTVSNVKDVYKPERKYRRHDADKLRDEESRVQSTLLEYGRRYGISRSDKEEDDDKSAKKKAAAAGIGGEEGEKTLEELQAEEEKRINMLMSGMSAMGLQEGKLTASTVGSIVGMQSAEIQQIASEYAEKQAEIEQIERSERVGGAQQHKRVTAALEKQIQQAQDRMKEVQSKHDELHRVYKETQEKLREAQARSGRIDEEMEKLAEMETEENQGILQTLKSLVAMNENLKKQEQEFKAHCKEEMTRLKANIEQLKKETNSEMSEDQARAGLIEKQYNADKEKLHKIRLLLARKNREIGGLQRKIDEVPSRAELSQYQRRFVELYNQVASTHKETKQFYTLYNTLDDTKLYLSKEVTLLNSIYDNFSQAMSSAANKEQFLKQFEQIVDGVKTNKSKVERKKQEEKMRRDQLNDTYLDLIEKQRLYFKTVKDFQEECRKNEILLSKMKR